MPVVKLETTLGAQTQMCPDLPVMVEVDDVRVYIRRYGIVSIWDKHPERVIAGEPVWIERGSYARD